MPWGPDSSVSSARVPAAAAMMVPKYLIHSLLHGTAGHANGLQFTRLNGIYPKPIKVDCN